MSPPSTPPPHDGLVHMTIADGHRQAYLDLFTAMFGLGPSVGPIAGANRRALVAAERLFFGTLDDDVAGFVRIALLRALRGRKTCGLFLRANTCLEPGLRGRIKYALFAALKRVPRVSTVSIIPFSTMPGIERVATDWVHDPQLWDQVDAPPAADAALMDKIRALAAGRKVVSFLGWLTHAKAFPRLARLYRDHPDVRAAVLVVAAGRPEDPQIAEAAGQLKSAGALVLDRHMTDGEIAAIYRCSDAIWSSYAPGYDQASGIFGRAVQEGRPVIVRDDSTTLAGYVALLGHPAMALSGDDALAATQLQDLAERLSGQGADRATTQATLAGWRAHFQSAIASALA